MKKPGWLKDTIAKPNGYYTPKGELVKRKSLSKEEIDAWNGVEAPKPTPAPAPEFVAEPVVEEVETDTPASVDEAMNEPGEDADFTPKPGSKIVDMFKPRK
jgi:hypothetical protein